jgi:putative DNA primase/helicase
MFGSAAPEIGFAEAMAAAGISPPPSIKADGTLHRFSTNGRRDDAAGWYILHGDTPAAGAFGCWRSGFSETWCEIGQETLSPMDRQRQAERMAQAKARAQAEREREQAEAAEQARTIWNAAKPAPADHPYLVRKGVQAHGLRIGDDGRLIVPMSLGGALVSVQRIGTDGEKRFLKGGIKKGTSYNIPGKAGPVVIAEGFATAASVVEATGLSVVVAFDAGNLDPVAREVRATHPAAAIVIAGDSDLSGVGQEKAQAAALAVGARVVIPPETGDWNDYGAKHGLAAVAAAFLAKDAGEAPWPDLVPLGVPTLPRMPETALPDWAGAYASALADATETPPELAVSMVLAACSVAVSRWFRVMVRNGYFEPTNLWIAAALPPGNRKSAVQGAAASPLLAWERERAEDMAGEIKRVTSEVASLTARANHLRQRAAKEDDGMEREKLQREAAAIEADMPEIPRPPQLWTSDATPERLGTILADNGERMAWLSSEGGVFDLLAGRYSGGIPNLDLVLKAHSGDSERVDRGSRPPVFLRHPLLTVGLSPQPSVLHGLASKPGFRGRGLLGRFLYLLPPSPLGYRSLEAPPIHSLVASAYEAGLRAILDMPPAVGTDGDDVPHVLRLSAGAYREWLDFARYIESTMKPGGEFEGASDWAGKCPGAAARMAGVLHVIEHAGGSPWAVEISEATIGRALEIMAVIAQHSRHALDLMGADESISAARRAWEWIEGGRRARFSLRESFNALRGTFPRVADLREAFDALAERGYLEIIEPPKAGPGRPPSPAVIVRPDIAEGWR